MSAVQLVSVRVRRRRTAVGLVVLLVLLAAAVGLVELATWWSVS